MQELAVQFKHISMEFPGVLANDDVSLDIRRGEVFALVGENGAGKTTLMNILYGINEPTDGEVIIGGKKVEHFSPKNAISLGVGMVHQHFMLVPSFTVAQNIVMSKEPRKLGFLFDNKAAEKKTRELVENYGLMVDPSAVVQEISVGLQQRVEILKALYRGADILILDEPTSSLTPQEIEELIVIMRNLTRDGKSIIIITHKLKEIKAAADFCTIIRQGKYIRTVDVEEVNENDLASMMVGRNVTFTVDKPEMEAGDVVLDVKDLHCNDYRDVEIVKGLNLQVRRGQIVGIAGIDGNGQTELVEVITGLRKGSSGQILVNGVDVCNKPPRFGFDHGVSSIPADRQKHGLILDFSVEDNLILQNYEEEPYSKKGIFRRDAIFSHATESIENYDIRPQNSERRPAGTLSGGNQQKVIIAREVQNDKDLLIAVNPTRGLDVGAIEYVHKYIVEQRNKGKAVLLVSFELDEIMSLSDTIDVIFDGKIVASMPGKGANENDLGLLMAGGKANG